MTGSTKTLPSPALAMDRARAEAVAAYAIASDPNCNAGLAVPHIVQAWRWFYMGVEREPPPGAVDVLAKWVGGQCERTAGKRRAASAMQFLETHAETIDPPQLGEAEVVAQLSVLRDRVDDERRRAGDLPPVQKRVALWGRRVAVWGGISVLAFLIALRPWEWTGIGQWRGAYYPGKDLRGDPDIRRDANVDFDWGASPPTTSIPSDRFAAQWDTCLVLEEEQDWTFQLIADDGARLFVDGEAIIDIWKPGKELPTAAGADYEFGTGVYHLRVQFIEEDDSAEVHLTATSDPDLPPGPIPPSLLRYPGEEFDEEDPCSTAEAG